MIELVSVGVCYYWMAVAFVLGVSSGFILAQFLRSREND
jgi:hypothetical protein